MPKTTIVEMPPPEQARRLAEVRRARAGHLLALPLLLLCTAGRTPREIAAILFGSRSSVYRVGKAYWVGTRRVDDPRVGETGRGRRRILTPSLKRAVEALLKTVPRAWGGGRPRWRCATLALELPARRGGPGSTEPLRRWLHELGWVGKRAPLAARDAAPQRVEKVARLRVVFERRQTQAALFFAAALEIPLLPKVGYHGMPQGEPGEVLTPGPPEKRYLAGALDMRTGTIRYRVGGRKTPGLFLALLQALDPAEPPGRFPPL